MVGMDDTIKLDRRSFEALAADSRVRVLKALSKRRKTLTELSNELGLSVSTMKEHLDVLVGAGLIIQKDEGRKWKYYELTRKGKGIVNPYPAKVLIMLAVSLVLVFGSGWNFINAFGAAPVQGDSVAAEGFMLGEAAAPEEAAPEGEMPRAYAVSEAEMDAEYIEAEAMEEGGTWAGEEKTAAGESMGPWETDSSLESPGLSAKTGRAEFPVVWAGLLLLGVALFLVSAYYLWG